MYYEIRFSDAYTYEGSESILIQEDTYVDAVGKAHRLADDKFCDRTHTCCDLITLDMPLNPIEAIKDYLESIGTYREKFCLDVLKVLANE